MIEMNVFRHAEAVDYGPGNKIFSTGEEGTAMYVIMEGEVDILVGSQVVETAGPGSIFGEMALIDKAPRSASAVAKTACKLVMVDERRFQFLVQETPYFALDVMAIMANRLRRANASAAQSA